MSDHISRLDPSQEVGSSHPKLCVRYSLVPRLRNGEERALEQGYVLSWNEVLGDESFCCMSFFLAMTNLLRTHFCDCFAIL